MSYLVKRPPVRYSYTVRERHHIIIPVKPVLSGLTFRLQMRCENVECHSSCLSCEQYGNSDLQEPYCPSAFGFRTVWLLQVRISILLPPSAGGMLQTDPADSSLLAACQSGVQTLCWLVCEVLLDKVDLSGKHNGSKCS